MRRTRSLLVCVILSASVAGCAFDAGSNGHRSDGGGLAYSDGYGLNDGYAPSGGYGFNGVYPPRGGYASGDDVGYDSGAFGSGYSDSGGIAGAYHYYGY
jgi:hypothetical protein